MKLLDAYPLVTTDRLADCRDFYVRHFGFEVGFEAAWFVYVHRPAGGPDEAPASLAFLAPDHPSSPPGPERFEGRGLLLTLQVDDARSAERALRAAGVPIPLAARDEPWGQIRFQCRDPAGMTIDVVQQVAPEPGYWDRWLPALPLARRLRGEAQE